MSRYRLPALVCLVFLLCSGPARAGAEDLEITITGKALERFFTAAAPFLFQYHLLPGKPAVEMSMTNPRVVLAPGRPGRVFLELDYKGESRLFGLAPFSGKARPEVKFAYDRRRAALRVSLSRFRIKLTPKLTVPLDSLIKPNYLPLTPYEPIERDHHLVDVTVAGFKTVVTKSGLRLLINYRFIRLSKKE